MEPRTERRAERRRPVNVRATVVYDDGVARLDARITDVSKAGARLELSSQANLPRHFYMLTPPHQLQPCAVVWQADRTVGVLFRLAAG